MLFSYDSSLMSSYSAAYKGSALVSAQALSVMVSLVGTLSQDEQRTV